MEQEKKRRIRILDAAEFVFAARGYDGASLRAIAARAEVDVALIAHYFGSKQQLFEKVLSRYADIVYQRRLDAFAKFKTAKHGQRPTVDELVDIYMRASYTPAESANDWLLHIQLISRLSVQPQFAHLVSKIYDPTALLFIDAMRDAVPDASDEQLYWGYYMMLGTLTFIGAQPGRIEFLSGGRFRTVDTDVAHKYLVQYVSAGLKSVVNAPDAGKAE